MSAVGPAVSTITTAVGYPGPFVPKLSTPETKQLALTWCVPEKAILDPRPVEVRFYHLDESVVGYYKQMREAVEQTRKDDSARLASALRTKTDKDALDMVASDTTKGFAALQFKLNAIHHANVAATTAQARSHSSLLMAMEYTHKCIGEMEERERTTISLIGAAMAKVSKLEERLKALEARPHAPAPAPAPVAAVAAALP